MRIWIDLANSPHVLFFIPIIDELHRLGHKVSISARDFAQTRGLLDLYGIEHELVGVHGGRGKGRKLLNIFGRALMLRRWVKKMGGFNLALSHNSYAQIIAARLSGIPAATLMDYEFQPANHIAFRLARRVIVPFTFSERDLRRYGAKPRKVRKYGGLKEEVYLAGFIPDPHFISILKSVFAEAAGYDPQEHLLFLTRPPATMSAYHDFENPLFVELLRELMRRPEVRTILLPRTEAQQEELQEFAGGSIVIPAETLEGRNAVWHADAVISAGGTMCREAAVFGTPSFSIFRGRMGSVDKHLISCGRMSHLESEEDFGNLPRQKMTDRNEISAKVRDEVLELCLSTVEKT
ncbi:MAG TPA: DUF354 domain-containing protein [Acidobacteriota bacterium]|nr:DUF354 domain-containing protein [Acidobacteriota bacterium]